jgi:hypothetical protein
MTTDNINDLLPDPEDDPRDASLMRAYTQHDTLAFDGKAIRPVSAGSMAIMEKVRNGLIFGDKSSLLFDTAAFVLLHTDDEKTFRAARRAAWSNDWSEFVINWLDATPDVHAKLTAFAPAIREMMNDYGKSLTKSMEANAPGNAGGRIG